MERQPQIDYADVARHLGVASIVGIGESTHGTHEFFETKAEVFKILVTDHDFDVLFLESVDDHCKAINNFLYTGEGNLEELVNKLFYVYRTEEVKDLLKWLREHHDEHPVSLVGIDERKYVDDYQDGYSLEKVNLRDKRMAEVVKQHRSKHSSSRGMIWAHDAHIAAYLNPPEFAPGGRHIPMGENLRNWFGNDYYSVAQLFGIGHFSAALIEEAGEFDNSKLISHYARKTSKYFWENHLGKILASPTFLEGPDYAGLVESGEVHYQRGLGWGVKHSVMHDNGNVMYVDISKAYNALLFFPRTTASHLLVQELGTEV